MPAFRLATVSAYAMTSASSWRRGNDALGWNCDLRSQNGAVESQNCFRGHACPGFRTPFHEASKQRLSNGKLTYVRVVSSNVGPSGQERPRALCYRWYEAPFEDSKQG